jgi:hypothetical protein
MSKYIEDLQGGKIIHDQKEEVELSKMSGDDIKLVKLTKMWLTAAASLFIVIAILIGVNSAIDRIETGHAITTTKTEQTVHYPKESLSNDIGSFITSESVPGYNCESHPGYVLCKPKGEGQ